MASELEFDLEGLKFVVLEYIPILKFGLRNRRGNYAASEFYYQINIKQILKERKMHKRT